MRCPRCGSYDVSERFDVCYDCGFDRRSYSCDNCIFFEEDDDCDGPTTYYCRRGHMFELPNESEICVPCLDYCEK